MSDPEWQSCTRLWQMWQILTRTCRAISSRKYRLFVTGCCRQVWPAMKEARCRRAVEVAERYADGRATPEELEAASAALPWDHAARLAAGPSVQFLCCLEARRLAVRLAKRDPRDRAAMEAAELPQVELLRDLVGSPLCPPASRPFPPRVRGLAGACYAAFPEVRSDFLILADALEDLGEGEAADHCRQPSHARGCHIIDWILGKE